ncbi:unnamed protein product [Cuscuta epithymum]|uniref:Uncharacterized protein n=1 Tax=Cuscuta epithymum TaxID=186058 RepID=A0AAV0CIJ1_9ASTE|nr:unnamed protein product [Cuscuta epithymum]
MASLLSYRLTKRCGDYTLGWDEIRCGWFAVERDAERNEWKEVDPDLKQLGRGLAVEYTDPPDGTVKTIANGYGHVVDFVPCELGPEPGFLQWTPSGTRSRRRRTKGELEAERRMPNKMRLPDPATLAHTYIPSALSFSPTFPTSEEDQGSVKSRTQNACGLILRPTLTHTYQAHQLFHPPSQHSHHHR